MTPAYHLAHPSTPDPIRLHFDHPTTLHCAFALCLPPSLRRRLSHQEERALLGGLTACPERGTWQAGAWTLTRLGEGE